MGEGAVILRSDQIKQDNEKDEGKGGLAGTHLDRSRPGPVPVLLA